MSLLQPSVDLVLASDDLSRFQSELEEALQAHTSRLEKTPDLDDISVWIRRRSEDLLDEIAAALSRIQEGSFGRCQHCSSAVSFDRLEAMPHTRFCTTCAAQDRGDTWR